MKLSRLHGASPRVYILNSLAILPRHFEFIKCKKKNSLRLNML